MRDGSERVVESAELPKIDLASLEELQLAEPPSPNRWRLGYLVRTTAGDGLRTERLYLREDRLILETPLTGLKELPLNSIALLWFVPPATLPAATRHEIELASAGSLRQDTLFVRKEGEWVKLEGILVSLNENRVVFRWQETEREIPLTLAGALVLAGAQPSAMPHEQLAAVTGRDGSRLVGALRSCGTDSLELESPALGLVTIPLESVALLDAIWGRCSTVSSLEPVSAAESGFFGTRFPWQRDLSVSGQPLTIHGRVFEHGLGVHSRSSLLYKLEKKFTLLTGLIGLDDNGGKRGNVEFVVRGDGKELFRGTMEAADAPKPLRVAVSGVDQLELLVDFGKDQDTGDHADWARLRLVR